MNNSSYPIQKEIVLIGGGHSHIQVVKHFAMHRLGGLRITLISDVNNAPYSGMLPGLLAGWYDFDEGHFDLPAICRRAGVRFIRSAVTGLDAQKKLIFSQNRPPITYDLASIDVGIKPTPLSANAESYENFMPLKPIGRFLERWRSFWRQVETQTFKEPLKVTLVGGGAAGVEISVILAQQLRAKKIPHKILLVGSSEVPLPGQSVNVQKQALEILQCGGIEWHGGHKARDFNGRLLLTDKGEFASNFVFCATQAKAPEWFGNTGLSLDEYGFLAVEDNLLVRGQSEVFAAGDCATFLSRPLPKAGVYAVRQGPVLADNLYRSLLKKKLKSYRPQKKTLFLITSGRCRALAAYGPFAFESAAMWNWKDHIDRKFMRKFQEMPPMDVTAPPRRFLPDETPKPNTCGGCGAKIDSDLLHETLQALRVEKKYLFSADLGADDCSIIAFQPGRSVLHNLDAFRSFIDDPYLLGRVIAEHSLNDIYAMGGRPTSAQALVGLTGDAPRIQKRDLFQLMSGIAEGLTAAQVKLAGGHTMETAELMAGLSVLGDVVHPIKKNTAKPGDLLILAKPLGSGALLAAHMMGAAQGRQIEALLTAMLQNQHEAMKVFLAHGAHAMTDVTGFGLAGHLFEMLKDPGLKARVFSDKLPIYEGFNEALKAGHVSALSEKLRASLVPHIHGNPPEIFFDPQTAGGLLAALPADTGEVCLEELKISGYPAAAIIGEILTDPPSAADSTATIFLKSSF